VVPGVTAALAAAAQAQRPLTRRGAGRSVALSTAMTATDTPSPAAQPLGRSADTEVFYMAGQQLPALRQRLLAAGWSADTPALVVSRAGCADALCSQHPLSRLHDAALLHRGRPTVVTLGVGAAPLSDVSFAPPATLENAMTHVVTESCIRCKYTDCVDVCPVDCFREGPTSSPSTPTSASTAPSASPSARSTPSCPRKTCRATSSHFIKLNADLARKWPASPSARPPLPDADDWKDRQGQAPS
jgi:NAD-dependent dihydropyrimidine dehydrogenase PreA subunit